MGVFWPFSTVVQKGAFTKRLVINERKEIGEVNSHDR